MPDKEYKIKIKDLEISENNYSIKDNAMHLKIIYKNIFSLP